MTEKSEQKRRLIHLYIGDGKGKTTAAIGQAVRAAGSGYAVLLTQFQKSKETGEIATLEHIPHIMVLRPSGNYPFYKDMTEVEKASLRDEHERIFEETRKFVATKTAEGQDDILVVCDELLHAMRYDLIDTAAVTEWILARPAEIVVTGRLLREMDAANETAKPNAMGNATLVAMQSLFDEADYITEMKAVRHPYEKGIMARRGIEF